MSFKDEVDFATNSRKQKSEENPEWSGNGYVIPSITLDRIAMILKDPNCRVVVFKKKAPSNLKRALRSAGIIVEDNVTSNEDLESIMSYYSTDVAGVERK